tara:strand:+ start:318 stop:614 length:297 start_codon:yes stop_codon:yes gene_type:complete
MYKPLPEFLTIKSSSIHGLGLYSVKEIPKNYILGVTHIKDERFEDGYIRTPLGGFFNHSKDPNCEVVSVGDYLLLLTIKRISSNVEITAKYSLYDPEV